MFKFEKYQRAILGPSSSDSVATLEMKCGKTFSWVCMGFLKKASQKGGTSIKPDRFYQNFCHFNKKTSFLYLNKNQ